MDVERENAATDVPAQPAAFFHLGNRTLQPARDPFILAADVDDPLAGANGVTGQRHAFQPTVRVALHQDAVLERPRFRLVGVANDVFRWPTGLGDHPPLATGREARSTAPPQT